MLMLWMFGRESRLVWGRGRFPPVFIFYGRRRGLDQRHRQQFPHLWGMIIHHTHYRSVRRYFGVLIACVVLFPDRKAYLFPIPVGSNEMIVAAMTVISFLARSASATAK